jgi:membrane-associated phospholipid phosphatase
VSAPTDVRRPTRRLDLWLLPTALSVVLLSGLLALAGRVPDWEEGVFELVNGVPLPVLLVWPVMQLGNVVAVPVAGLVAACTRRWRLAVELVLAGTLAYVVAKVLKELVDRGRPGELLEDVVLHGAPNAGRGFPSGHAAVAAALVLLVLPHLGPRGRQAAVLCAVLVCLARLWVGAHLPLDVVGGAALGIAAAALVRTLVGPTTMRGPAR